MNENAKAWVEALRSGAETVHEIAEQTGITTRNTIVKLRRLEREGRVKRRLLEEHKIVNDTLYMTQKARYQLVSPLG